MDTSARLLCTLIGIVFLVSPARAQDTEQVSALSQRVAAELSTIYRYDSNITVHGGVWLSRFVHLRLDAAGPAEVIFLSVNPRLLSQVSEFLESSSEEREGGSVEFHEYRLLAGDIKTDGIGDGFAGIWLRIEGPKGFLNIDDMRDRPPPRPTSSMSQTHPLPC